MLCCPHCNSDQVVKCGTTAEGKQRYRCQNDACSHRTFVRDYSYRALLPEVKQQMIDMAVNASGIRDTGRVLGIVEAIKIVATKSTVPQIFDALPNLPPADAILFAQVCWQVFSHRVDVASAPSTFD